MNATTDSLFAIALLAAAFATPRAHADAAPATAPAATQPATATSTPAAIAAAASSELDSRPRHVNLRVQPVGLLFGIWGANVDFALSRRVDLGPSFEWFGSNASGREVIVRQYGLTATFYPSVDESSRVYLRSSFGYLPVQTFVGTRILAAPNYSLDAIVGYQWLWAPGFNLGFGVGIVYHDVPPGSSGAAVMGTPISEVQPELDWSVGWQF